MTGDKLKNKLISAILELTKDEAAEVLRELKAKGLIKGAAI